MKSKVLTKFIKTLNQEKIDYVVLRNYNPLDFLLEGRDIDVYVAKRDLKKCFAILRMCGWKKRFIPSEKQGYIIWYNYDVELRRFLILDIQFHLYFGKEQYDLLKPEEILKKRILKSDLLYVPTDEHAVILRLCRYLFEKPDKFFSSEEDFLRLQEKINFFISDASIIRPAFQNCIVEVLRRHKNYESVDIFKERLIKVFSQSNLQRSCRCYHLIIHRVSVLLHRYLNIFRGVRLVSFVGVDGSGKTTLINLLKKDIVILNSTAYLGWNNYFFPFCGKLPFVLFHIILPFDIFFRYLRAKMLAKYQIVISDRYPLDPRTRLKDFNWWNPAYLLRILSYKITIFLLPRPDLVLVLTGNPQMIWKRKEEGDYRKFLNEFRRIEDISSQFICNTVNINTNCPIDDSMSNLTRELFLFFKDNFKIYNSHLGIRRGNGFVILKTKRKVYKIPILFRAFKELHKEHRSVLEVERDYFFKKYIPKRSFNYFFSSTERGETWYPNELEGFLILFFRKAFQDSDTWKIKNIGCLIDSDLFLGFIKNNREDLHFWESCLSELKIPQSSSHGDFHADNVLFKGNTPFFIDWGNYSRESSRFFDIIDYKVTSCDGCSWIENFRKLTYGMGASTSIYGIKVDKNILIAYVIWKITKELRVFSYKDEKYKMALDITKKLLKNEYEY